MEIFEGTPKEKFFDVLLNANRNIVEYEIEALFKRYSLMEIFCENNGFDVWSALNAPVHEDDDISDLYIELTSSILSKNE